MQEYGDDVDTSTCIWPSCHCIPGLIKSLAIFWVCYLVDDNGAKIETYRRKPGSVTVALDIKHKICKVG